MKEYIMKSLKNSYKEYFLFNKVPIFILSSLPNHIDLNKILNIIETSIPSKFIFNIEGIYFSELKEMKERNIQAMFKDGVIYVSSFQDNENISEDIIAKDIIHEIAHSIEDKIGFELYNDGELESEFLGKRKKLKQILISNGYDNSYLSKYDFYNSEYSKEFDNFLYEEIGYDKLSILSMGLFLSPYSITSLREYFGNGFEEYYIGQKDYLKDTSKVLYLKIKSISKLLRGL